MPTPEDTEARHECTEFEALLADALEGQLTGARKESFEAHRRTCAVCGPLFADVTAGREWLRSLEPVEPPVHLVHNILVATSGVVSTRVASATGRVPPRAERLREWWDSWFAPVSAFVRQPRFAMSFGMIFFSFSLALNVAGVKASDVARIDLRPAAVRHAYNDAQIKVVKFYDNIRFVYEIESKVRELKRATAPAEPGTQEQKPNRKNDTSGQPDQRQDRNYSKEQDQTVLAKLEVPSEPAHSRSACIDPTCNDRTNNDQTSNDGTSNDQTFLRQVAKIEPPGAGKLLLARGSRLEAQSSLTTNRRFV